MMPPQNKKGNKNYKQFSHTIVELEQANKGKTKLSVHTEDGDKNQHGWQILLMRKFSKKSPSSHSSQMFPQITPQMFLCEPKFWKMNPLLF